MEYLVLGLILAILVVLEFRQPNKIKKYVLKAVVSQLKNNEAEICHKVYQNLPPSIKEKADEKLVEDLTALVINAGIELIEEEVDNQNKKHRFFGKNKKQK